MKMDYHYRNIFLLIFLGACTYDQNPPPPLPPSSEETANLEATYTVDGPNSITAQYWATADYIQIFPEEISLGSVYEEDGLLNMTGLFGGLPDFNDGDSSALRIKAAYDDVNLYLLAEWVDQSYDLSQATWIYDGADDPNKPGESSAGWTSQFNDDNIIFSFPFGDNQDIWKWSLAVSEPLGYAIDMIDNGSGSAVDEGDILVLRNSNGSDNRTGPTYEWDGVDQEVVRPLAQSQTFLDPAFYLLNKTDFSGDLLAGQAIYEAECAECHGPDGDGDGTDWNTGVSMKEQAFNRLARGPLDDVLSANSHSGNSYWTQLNDTEKNDLIARLRGFSGVPGYYIENETGTKPDVLAISSEVLGRVNYNTRSKENYKVLLVRPLNTGNGDDIQFDPSVGSYTFSVYLTDNDDPNRVGAEDHTLVFKP